MSESKKIVLLYKIWSNKEQSQVYALNGIHKVEFDYEQAKEAIKSGFIDYFCGKYIDFSKNNQNSDFQDE